MTSQLGHLAPALLMAGFIAAVVIQLGRSHRRSERLPRAPRGADARRPLETPWLADADLRRLNDDLATLAVARPSQAPPQRSTRPSGRGRLHLPDLEHAGGAPGSSCSTACR